MNADNVEAILRDCLYRTEELNGSDTPPDGAVLVEGVVHKFGFHPERLASHKSEVAELLLELPSEFMQSSGGGWSFLNSCIDKDDVLWTGLHRTRAGYLPTPPRDMAGSSRWDAVLCRQRCRVQWGITAGWKAE